MMTTCTFPVARTAALVAPANLSNSACLHVYDDFPDQQDWRQDVLARAQACASVRVRDHVTQWATFSAGAPVGNFLEESYRVARAFGLIAPATPSTAADPMPPVLGAGVAQGLCYATWRHTADVSVLVVTFDAPDAFGWGAGKTGLSLEHLKARCLHQYHRQARSLLEHIHGLDAAQMVQTEFVGEWGPETECLRSSLSAVCQHTWSAVSAGPVAIPSNVAA